jgi:hypothetical protein
VIRAWVRAENGIGPDVIVGAVPASFSHTGSLILL